MKKELTIGAILMGYSFGIVGSLYTLLNDARGVYYPEWQMFLPSFALGASITGLSVLIARRS